MTKTMPAVYRIIADGKPNGIVTGAETPEIAQAWAVAALTRRTVSKDGVAPDFENIQVVAISSAYAVEVASPPKGSAQLFTFPSKNGARKFA